MKGLLIVNNFMHSKKFYDLYNIFIDASRKLKIDLTLKRTGELLHNIDSLSSLNVDFVIFWDKDVVLCQMLEALGISVFNNSKAIENCDNKAKMAVVLESHKIRIPETFTSPLSFERICEFDFLDPIIEKTGIPFVIKEVYGSFGQQVFLAKNKDDAINIISSFNGRSFIIQEFISSSFGRDIRVNVIGDKVVSSILRESTNGDFRSNLSLGGKMTNISVNEDVSNLCIKSAKAFDLDFAGIDVLFGKNDEPIICELNSNPHFRTTLECTGYNMAEGILRHIISRLNK